VLSWNVAMLAQLLQTDIAAENSQTKGATGIEQVALEILCQLILQLQFAVRIGWPFQL
jgi:hypothetical protein